MITRSSNTAILLFARSTESELHEKWLPKGEEIYTLLNDRAIKLAEESGLQFFHSTEQDQVGEDFGARFSHAIQNIFDQGYTSVISLGNDTPQLTQKDIQTALAHIREKNSVMGPSKDGGVYLLGIHAADFDLNEFSKLKWRTRHVQESLADYIRSRGKSLVALRLYRDIDSVSDMPFLLNIRGIIPISILNILRIAVRRIILWVDPPTIHRETPLWQPNLNKGSPL